MVPHSHQRNLQPFQTNTASTMHIMSSPCNLQSNGFVECMVQTVKQSMRKCAAGVHDPTLAMLIYRATPLISITCRAIQRMNTALVPTRSPIQNPYCQVIWEQTVKDEDKLYEHHNKTARDLPGFTSTESESVKVHPQSNQCTPATVTKMSVASQLRSYTVETANCYNGAQLVYYNGAQLVRNRHFISPAQETALIPVKNVKVSPKAPGILLILPPLIGRDKPWPFFHFWRHHFDQNWHHLYSTSAGGKYLSNDAQIGVIGLMEPEICTKMLKTMREKLRPNFPATTPGCSMVKIGHLDDAFLEVF